MARWWSLTDLCAIISRAATLYLEYEAYEPMAYAKMREIGAEIREKFPIHRVAIVHRLGRSRLARPAC